MTLDEVASKAAVCIRKNIPFSAFALPSQSEFRLFINPSWPDGKGERFIISPWLTGFSEAFSIYNEVPGTNPSDISIETSAPAAEPESESTVRQEYIKKLGSLIEKLKVRGGKTVISRIICGDAGNIDIGDFIRRRFSRYVSTFRFAYFTPETGTWIGTSPEELLSYDSSRGRFSITSLAGTRRNGQHGEWDAKNIVEQSLVSRFIGDTLDECGLKHISKVCNDVDFYPVRHLCHRFFGQIESTQIPYLIEKLSPTPALCGYPRENAIEEISEVENFSRRCYGGYIGFQDSNSLILYVNLRCINMSQERYCIYAGGGITGASDPVAEWDETASKSETMTADIAASSRS